MATSNTRCDFGDTHHLSELRIVMLGNRRVGKSSAGNTILGREEFELKRTAEGVKRQGQVAGRQITVVEAPGWWSFTPVEESTELLKQEIVFSVSLCPPGPHAVLLLIHADRLFKEDERRVVEGHLQLLSERVWSHTLVLFTYGDCLGDTAIEQLIESEGKQLQCLVEKCGNRYHVLNNINRSDDTQVTELLEKIEEMVAANSLEHFQLDTKMLQELQEKRRQEERRLKERRMLVQKQREDIRSHMCDTRHLSELRIVMLGNRYAGKSSAGNTILGREEFELKRTAACVKRQGQVAGRQITVVEAPGWWSFTPVEFSTELLKQEIVLSVSLCPPGPHAVLLLIHADSSFKENKRRVVEGYLQLLSKRVWSHTLVLFTYGDCLGDTAIEQHIESEGKQLQWLVEKCGNRYHVLNNINRSDDTQVTELLEKIEEMVAVSENKMSEEEDRVSIYSSFGSQSGAEQNSVISASSNSSGYCSLTSKVRSMQLESSGTTMESTNKARSNLATWTSSAGDSGRTSPVSSGLSMKSDRSMTEPLKFRGSKPHDHESVGVKGRTSPVPSELSVQSDQTVLTLRDETGKFRTSFSHNDKSVGVKGRTSPVPSELTVASNWSMEEPETFSGPFPHSKKRRLEEIAGPGDVACDICTKRKVKAVKSCLTCTASYCEVHVRKHYTAAVLQIHKLVEATHLEHRVCKQHNRALELFCTTDQMDICTLCLSYDHKGHNVTGK